MDAPSDELLAHINKRFTLNLLIQGASTHTLLTAHYLVKEQLDAIDPELTPLYDKFAVGAFLGYWYGDLVLVCGRPKKFWRRTHRPDHPFHRHSLLAKHGGALASAAKAHAIARAKSKGVSSVPFVHYAQIMRVFFHTMAHELDHEAVLSDLARDVAVEVWGIEKDRVDAQLTRDVEFGRLREPESVAGKVLRMAAVGYSGVLKREGQLVVVAKAWNWPFLAHEAVKGSAELICLHGMRDWDAEIYAAATEAADGIEHETWLMQAGSELWRRLLPLLPEDVPLSQVLMQIARLTPARLEHLMLAVVEEPEAAEAILARFGE